ncbi:hypothetical protein [Streptomyces sp. NPDC001508]|uniref:hypothetical protein n=1 Tax=Streptomyces sp. NPDC001508 TaxID=3154656 RepID=UPI00332349C3
MPRTALLTGLVGALVALAAAAPLRRAGAALILKTTGTVVRDERPRAHTAGVTPDGR